MRAGCEFVFGLVFFTSFVHFVYFQNQIQTNEKTIEEMQSTNYALNERLENVYRSMSLSPHANSGNMSLLNEMELSDSEKSLNASRRPFSQIDEVEDVECDNPDIQITDSSTANNNEVRIVIFDRQKTSSFDTSLLFKLQFKDEMLSSYQQIKTICSQLRQRTRRNSSESVETTSSSEEVGHSSALKPGSLDSALQELRGLVHDLLRKEAKGTCLSCGADSNDKIRMEVQLHKTQEQKEKLERRLKDAEDQNKRKDDEILELISKLSLTETRLQATEEERDILQGDVENTNGAKDELIKKAWEVRDAAVKRKNATEMSLARTRIDLMQVNSQLLEAIQQKVELSQQLDQWQSDMQELLEDQMVRKMRDQDRRSKKHLAVSNENGASDSGDSVETIRKKSSKILAFFQRS